ncbi:hypothetical protein DAEQUDRAFT_678786 [Daedalea quercina L-15889]|uniref:HAT C-terminal dimerisation domain-containing protein n=1 Tax=Daedalea quercina L-15889 TaxID=1314783 RepID=A0A165LEC5_9APHY|nr:hypothetical protein DAEQUDRAFT_678786 [Daedalea quercina L-15889]
MQRYGIHFAPENGQIRCLAHVVNLVVQKILASLIDADDPDVNDWYLLHKFLPFHYNNDENDELNELEDATFVADDEKLTDKCPDEEKDQPLTPDEPLNAVQKLRIIVRKVVSSPQRRSSFRKHAKRHYTGKFNPDGGREICTLMCVRDVRTRWNYWKLLEQLASMLKARLISDLFSRVIDPHMKPFTHVTRIMSKAQMPTLPWVLPMYAHMEEALSTTIASTNLPNLKVAAATGLSKLREYYTKAMDCQYYRVATICHPALRANWFSKLGAHEKLKAEALFEHVYKEYEKKIPRPADIPVQSQPERSSSFLDVLADVPDIAEAKEPEVVDPKASELARWYRFEGGKGDAYHPLVWWKVSSFK